MRALLRYLFLALTTAALVPVPGLAAGAPSAAVAAAMPGYCAHCGADDHVPARMPICCIPACPAAAIMAQTPAQAAMFSWSHAEYFAGPAHRLSGETPKTDPPPPKSLLVL
ncbi:MAG: hypothetical protein ACREE4_04950 [Stellaceae bacterium]